MIAFRSLLFRVDQALKLRCLKPEMVTFRDLKRFILKMAGGNDKKNEKLKPITTQTSSHEECSSNVKAGTVSAKAVKNPSRDYTHFISLPLATHPELKDKLFEFRNSILGCSDNKEHVKANIPSTSLVSHAPKSSKSTTPSGHLKDVGVEKSMFINPKTFHLTVLMLKLWNKERVDKAAKVLQSVSSQVRKALDNRPLSIRLRGLDCFGDSKAKARVVYAPVEDIGGERRLLRACQVIIYAFVKAGLVMEKDAKQSLKLHATVMNARHKKRVEGIQMTDYFDARHIFKRYGSKDWGEYVIHEAHLSQRFAYDDNGYFHCCGSMPFP